MKKVNIFATDTETNGLKFLRHNAITIAIVMAQKNINENENEVFEEGLSNLKSFHTAIAWQKIKDFDIPDETIEIHGINIEDLENAPNPIEAYSQCYKFIQEYLNGDKIDILNGFNVTFDLHMIIQDLIEIIKYSEENMDELNYEDVLNCRKLLDLFYNQDSGESGAQLSRGKVIETNKTNIKVIDSIIIDRIFHAVDENGIKIRHSLSDCSRRYGLEEDDNAHDALSDTIQTLETFNFQINELLENNIQPFDSKFEERLINKYYNVESAFAKSTIRSYDGR